MQGKTHLVAGALAGLLTAHLGDVPLEVGVLYAAVGGVAALVPDWLQVNLPGVKQVHGVFGHRGFSHWVWVALAAGWLLWPVGLGLPVAAGWLSHIGLDAFSSGVPAFWPVDVGPDQDRGAVGYVDRGGGAGGRRRCGYHQYLEVRHG